MTDFGGDARRAFRSLLANRTFVALAILCLAIGIGANTLVFTMVSGVLLEAPPFVDPGRLVYVGEFNRSAPNVDLPASTGNFLDWRASAGDIGELVAMRASSFAVGSSGSSDRTQGAYVTPDFFSVLGIEPIAGRGLLTTDDLPDGEPVVVISEEYWRRQCDADPAILGRPLLLDGAPHTIIGVLPSLLHPRLLDAMRAARIWIPLPAAAADAPRDDRSLTVIARLNPEVSIASAQARLDIIANELAEAHPENFGWSVRVRNIRADLSGSTRSLLLLMSGAVALVLLIACANVASLMLASAARRRHEFAIYTAMGATRWHIVRQLLIEGFIVSIFGALLGLATARISLDLLLRSVRIATGTPEFQLPMDGGVIGYAVGLTIASTLLFGLFPAWQAAHGAARAQLSEAGFGTTTAQSQDRVRRSLVVGQIAISLMLLFGASALLRSLANLLEIDGGVDTQRVTSIRVSALEQAASPENVASFVDEVIGALAAIPGVESVEAGNVLPLSGGGQRSTISVAGDAPARQGARPITYAGVTRGFFDAFEIPILRGRGFSANEARGTVAVVNESFANRLWPGENAIGHEFRLDAAPGRGVITVIGVSGDVYSWSSSNRPLPTAYFDIESLDHYPTFFFVRMRSAGQIVNPQSITRALESLKHRIEQVSVAPMEEVFRAQFWRQRLASLVISVFGIAALVLTAIGVYGLLTYLVWQRAREIGIRMALGANRVRVLVMVLRPGIAHIGIGTTIGVVGAYLLSRAMRGLLYNVAPFDATLFVGVAALLATVAMAASIAPAVRATRIDPNRLMRN